MTRTTLMLSLLLAAAAPLAAQAEAKYFGYFANNDWQAENQDHTNLTHIWTYTDNAAAREAIRSGLQQAKQNGNKAMISVDSYVFNFSGGDYTLKSDAATAFRALVDDLITWGYLVPNDPEQSTVAAIYPVDEPELHGLKDFAGAAHPALSNAINAIRADGRVAGVPIAVISSKKFRDALQGLRLYDWVGANNYGANDNGYIDTLGDLERATRPEQRIIVVPQAAQGGPLDESPHTPERMFQITRDDPRMIMLMPFLWGHADMRGTRTHAGLKASYTAIGTQIKYGLIAKFVSQSVNPSMIGGVPTTVSVTMKNFSGQTWRLGSNISLGSQNPGDNFTWGMHRVALPHAVAPQQNVTFSFNVIPPSTPGTYNFQWRMVDDGRAWFGDSSPNVAVTVKPRPTGSLSANPNPCVIPVGGVICTTTISWNSNQPDARILVSNQAGTNPTLFASGQSGSQSAPWISTEPLRFWLGIPGYTITTLDVRGVSAGAKERKVEVAKP